MFDDRKHRATSQVRERNSLSARLQCVLLFDGNVRIVSGEQSRLFAELSKLHCQHLSFALVEPYFVLAIGHCSCS